MQIGRNWQIRSSQPGTLQCVPWDEVGKRVTIPAWKKFSSEYSSALEGVTAESMPDQIPKLRQIGIGHPRSQG